MSTFTRLAIVVLGVIVGNVLQHEGRIDRANADWVDWCAFLAAGACYTAAGWQLLSLLAARVDSAGA